MEKPAKKHFTLLELTVIVSVAAITAAMLLPAVQTAASQAKNTRCIGNLQQLAGAVLTYAKNYNGHIEGLTGDSGWKSSAKAEPTVKCLPWSKNLFDIVKDPKVFVCPDDTTANSRKKLAKSSYGTVQLSGSIWPERWKAVTIDRFVDPAKFIHAMDSHSSWNNIGCADGAWQITYKAYKTPNRVSMYAPHENKTVSVASHYDGSVRTYTYPAAAEGFPGEVKEKVFF